MIVAQKDLYERASRAMFSLVQKSSSLQLPVDVILDLFEKNYITYTNVWLRSLGLRYFRYTATTTTKILQISHPPKSINTNNDGFW